MPLAFSLWMWLSAALGSGSADHGGAGASAGVAADGSMVLLLTILLGIGCAYLLAHFLVDRLQKRMLFVSGVEYVLLGILLGTSTGVLTDLDHLAPVVAFGTGWVGLLDGVGLRMGRLRRLPRWSVRLASVDLLVVGGTVALGAWATFVHVLGTPAIDAWLPAGVLGCAAASGSQSASKLLMRRYPQLARREDAEEPVAAPDGSLLRLVDETARLTQTFSILAFGVLLCLFHPDLPGVEQQPVAAEWLLLMLGLGLALGVLFRLLVSHESTDNQRFMAMVGIICFATGAAYFLDLSDLTVNLVLGAVLAQGTKGRQLEDTLTATLAPVLLLLLVLSGVLWTPVPVAAGVLLSAVALSLRALSKVAAGTVAAAGTPLRGDVGRGLLSQGAVALGMGLSYKLVFSGPNVDLAFTAILVSVVVSEAAAPRMLKGLLVDAGELREDLSVATSTRSA